LSWAHKADRLAFAYFENGQYNVYAVDNPRSLRRQPYQEQPKPPAVSLLLQALPDRAPAPPTGATPTPAQQPSDHDAASVYRSPSGLRSSAEPPPPGGSTADAAPLSVRTLLDSATLALPDTTEFTIRPYRTRFTTDFVARPTVGYQRNNFGRGIFGGSSISLSDMLGDRMLQLGGQLNGRLAESQVFGGYSNLSGRVNWAVGFAQNPFYFYAPSTIGSQTAPGVAASTVFTSRIRRLVVDDAFGAAFYPFSRFSRTEMALHLVRLNDATLSQQQYYDLGGRFLGQKNLATVTNASVAYVAPSLALVHDKTLFGFVGPFAGRRTRLQVEEAIGGWKFTGVLGDVRQYLFVRPFTLALRGVVYGRFGRDGAQFPVFLGNPDLVRGYTAGSMINHECYGRVTDYSRLFGGSRTGSTGCSDLDQLSGARIAVGNVELRFPLTRSFAFSFLPFGLPPIEAAVFYDAGLAWQNGSQLKWRRQAGDDPVAVRAPLQSWGGSIRLNLLGAAILRFDYTRPLTRTYNQAYWTVSFGPTF
jgi:hypothetical protein